MNKLQLILGITVFLAVMGASLSMSAFLGKQMKICQTQYNGNPHTKEILIATDSKGCQIKEIVYFNGNCSYIKRERIKNCNVYRKRE